MTTENVRFVHLDLRGLIFSSGLGLLELPICEGRPPSNPQAITRSTNVSFSFFAETLGTPVCESPPPLDASYAQ